MNGRILELAKNPNIFQITDLELLSSEIEKHPYIQSLRALHLLGTHRLQPENYSNELSITAAYTTDKKILYNLINSIEEKKTTVEIIPEEEIKEPEITEEIPHQFNEIKSEPIEVPTPVFVNGQLNRILFEGEEDFLERETEKIDLESTVESGQLVTLNPTEPVKSASDVEEIQNLSNDSEFQSLLKEEIIKQNPGVESQTIVEQVEENTLPEPKVDDKSESININGDQEFSEAGDAENFSKEKIVKEEEIEEQKPLVEKPENVSFHEVEAFIPTVKTDSEKKETKTDEQSVEVADAENFSREEIVIEEIILAEKPIIEDPSELSFHATTEFLPNVQIAPSSKKSEIKAAPKAPINKHEEEMQRLIAEVEAKMKAAKKGNETTKKKEEIPANADVNFSETQHFNISKSEEKPIVVQEKIQIQKEEIEKVITEKNSVKEENLVEDIPSETTESKPAWKPMSFSANKPDALITKKTEESKSKKIDHVVESKIFEETSEKVAENKADNQSSEREAFNVSFFPPNVSQLETAKKEEKPVAEKDLEDSNVPNFINTWQSWLKIDRNLEEKKEKIEISITEIKNKVIENFIEKEPRISKLKDESDFVIKERNDDISHLMTETLAKLYVEQKLYAKAIKAFVILTEKHPKKKDYFKDKIKEIKELRQNK